LQFANHNVELDMQYGKDSLKTRMTDWRQLVTDKSNIFVMQDEE